jgi:hypothetical protein
MFYYVVIVVLFAGAKGIAVLSPGFTTVILA